jgi:tetratricopeptide (TPR) repeat protein
VARQSGGPNRKIGPYEVLDLLGSGGMGVVYRAHDPRLGREVAVKVLVPEVVSDDSARDRFEREVRAVATLSHPNILAIHDIDLDGETVYAVMELLEGPTLRERIKSGPLSPRKAVDVGVQVARGLAAAHTRNLVHRDLKPENIAFTRDGQVKILDFGLVRHFIPLSDLANSPTKVSDTSPGVVLGTLGYMSPEQVRGQPVDHRSDIFSFGVVLYEILTGHRVFERSTTADTMSAILNDETDGLLKSGIEVPPVLDRVVQRCLEKDPERRFHSASDLAFALESSFTDSWPAHVSAPRSRIPPPYWFGGGTAFGLALALTINVLLGQSAIDSVAMLPFRTVQGDEATRYLAEGIEQRVRNRLHRLPLRVHSALSVSALRGAPLDLFAAIRALDPVPDAVISGEVTPDSIVVELINTRTNGVLWTGDYPLDDSVQNRIAEGITENLRLRLSGEDEEQLEIYRVFEEAQYRWTRRTEGDLLKAMQLYEEVIDRDPTHGRAYAGLALVQAVFPIYSQVDPSEYARLARDNAERSLELLETPEAHSALAQLAVNYERQWDTAQEQYRKAIQLDPDNPTAHQWFAEYFTAIGDFDRALDELDEAGRADSRSLVIPSVRGWVLHCAGRFEEAIRQFESVLDVEPDFGLALRFLGQAYIQVGDYERAIATLDRARDAGAGRPADRAYASAVAGDRATALGFLENQGRRRSMGSFVSDYELALVHTALGNFDEAAASLQRAIENQPWELAFLNVEPMFKPLRSDSRFPLILERLGLDR